jgi:hypothetical protein
VRKENGKVSSGFPTPIALHHCYALVNFRVPVRRTWFSMFFVTTSEVAHP